MAEAKAKVLALVSEGMPVQRAMEQLGKKPDTVRIWISRDKQFAQDLADAKDSAKENSLKALGVAREDVSFPQFSQMFLDQKVFPHHQDWIDLLEGKDPSWLHPNMIYEPGDKHRLLVNVPPEHAKSTVITVNYSTYRIALNPNVRIIVVSKTLVKAREFVYAIKQRLSHPRWLKLQTTFGPEGGWKEDSDTWRVDTVYLGNDARDSSEKDPTIQALGMGGQIYGARADLIILDDCITTANAHEHEKQINWLQKEVITRLGKNGKLLVVGTRIFIKNSVTQSIGQAAKAHLRIWVCLLFYSMPINQKTGKRSGLSRMWRGMGMMTPQMKKDYILSGMVQPLHGAEAKLLRLRGLLYISKKM